MPRIDPATIPPLPSVKETLTVTEPRIERAVWSFTFDIQDGFASGLVLMERVEALKADYCGEHAPKFVTSPGEGGTAPISELLVTDIAHYMLAERVEEGEEPWTFNQWALFAHRCPTAYRELRQKFAELEARLFPAQENGDADEETDPAEALRKND